MNLNKEPGITKVMEAISHPELTKREYFAGLAMQGILAACSSNGGFYLHVATDAKQVAQDSVEFADALLAELEKQQK